MKLKKINIISGSSTDVGKTYFTCNIIKKYFLSCKEINFIKPISSGFDYSDLQKTDAGKMLQAYGKSVDIESIYKISPFVFKAPTSPNIAMKLENANVLYSDILNFCIQKANDEIPLLIETAGGICTPITHAKTMLDLIIDLKNLFQNDCNNFFITSNYLGSISHTISACKLFEFDNIIFNPITPTEFDIEIINTIESFTKIAVVPLGGLEPPRA